MPQFNIETVTAEDCRENLEQWLDMAAHNPIYNYYDQLCGKAYELLSGDEYKRIYDRWASGYVACSDGYYRRR